MPAPARRAHEPSIALAGGIITQAAWQEAMAPIAPDVRVESIMPALDPTPPYLPPPVPGE